MKKILRAGAAWARVLTAAGLRGVRFFVDLTSNFLTWSIAKLERKPDLQEKISCPTERLLE